MPDPVCEALIFCELDLIEAQTNKHTLVGIFETLLSERFPFTSTRFSIHCVIANYAYPTENANLVLNIKQPRFGNVIASTGIRIDKATKPSRAPISLSARFTFASVVFPVPGRYEVELRLDEELIGASTLELISSRARSDGP